MTRTRRFSFGLLAALLFFGLAEAGLRLAGFRFDTQPRYMQFGYPDARDLAEVFQPDPALLWRLHPGELYAPDHIPVSQQGFRGFGFEPVKTAGTFRIIALGDSCTFFGRLTSWPERLAKKFGDADPGRAFEAINLAVPGYSSWQGRRLLETEGLALDPDLALIYFGWNDHWLHFGAPDRLQRLPRSRLVQARSLLARFRLFQLTSWAVAKARAAARSEAPAGAGEGCPACRVPLPEFRDNLRAMIALSREHGAEPVLITAPSGARRGEEAAAFLLESGMAPDGDWVLARHREYAEAVREIATEEKVILVDAAAEFERPGDAGLFWSDNIHLTEPGLDRLTELVFQACRDRLQP